MKSVIASLPFVLISSILLLFSLHFGIFALENECFIARNILNCSACIDNDDCFNCIQSIVNPWGNANVTLSSVCINNMCILRHNQQDINLNYTSAKCPCSLYVPPNCNDNPSSCTSYCNSSSSIRVDCGESASLGLINFCVTSSNCSFDPFDQKFCRHLRNVETCTLFCSLESEIPEYCLEDFRSSCVGFLEEIIEDHIELNDYHFVASQLERYSEELDLDEATESIYDLLYEVDMMEIDTDDRYYTFFDNIGRFLDRLLDDSNRNEWTHQRGRSSNRVFSSIEVMSRKLGKDISSGRANVSVYKYFGNNTIFQVQRRNVCKNQSHYEFPSVEESSESFVVRQAYMKIPYAALCNETCCSITVSVALADNIANYVTKYLVGDNSTFSNSILLSVSIFESKVFKNHLKDNPLEILFTPKNLSIASRGYEIGCYYWDNATISWMDDGIRTELQSDGKVKCIVNHLTSFAILVSPTGDLGESSEEALNIVSYIGCAVSIACLIVTLTVFIIMRKKLGKGILLPIHFNFCLALLIGLVIFVGGIETAVTIPVLCTIVAAAIQYFFLCAFCWMLSEGIMLYLLIVRVFVSLKKKWYFLVLFNWGLPIPIVGFSAGFLHSDYGTSEYCWIMADPARPAIWTFIGPIILIILINSVILVLTIVSIVRGKKVGGAEANVKKVELVKTALKGSIVLLPLLGLTWILGIFAVSQNTVVFAWLFTIFNSLQGFFVFLLHVARNEAFLKPIKDCFMKVKPVAKPTIATTDMQQLSRIHHSVSF